MPFSATAGVFPRLAQRRDRQAEGPRGFEVDHQLELCGLLDGQVGGLGALQDLVDIGGGRRNSGGVPAYDAAQPGGPFSDPEEAANVRCGIGLRAVQVPPKFPDLLRLLLARAESIGRL